MKRAPLVAAMLLVGALAARADDFPPGDAHDIVAKACTQCHVGAQVTSQHKTADQWADTVNQMISNGAQVSDDDFDKVVAYLAKNFGPVGGTPSTAAPAPH
jgi:mono/diheme cytochrome c family protein